MAHRLFLACLSAVLLGSPFALGQVTLDGSLGPKGAVPPGTLPDGVSTNYLISSDLGKQAGKNLFHSFQQFNVLANESATFTGPPHIENVIGRVTGGSASSINGLIRSTIDGANLFLLNPSGILLGPNATLDVMGSFHVSTADYLRFEDGGRFYSIPGAADQLLSVASPAAFGFLNTNPEKIGIQESALEVSQGRTLSFIGGDVEIQGGPGGFLYAPGGRIQIVSVASPGEVTPDLSQGSSVMRVDSQVLGKVDLSYQSYLDVSGDSGGSVVIRGGKIFLNEGSYIGAHTYGDTEGGGSISLTSQSIELCGGATVETVSTGSAPGGDILLQASSVAMDGASLVVNTRGAGKGGDIDVQSGTLLMRSGATLWSSSDDGPGKGGDIRVNATVGVTLSDAGPEAYSGAILSSTSGSGDGGRITVSSPSITADGGWIVGMSFASGNGALIQVEANDFNMVGDSLLMNVNRGSGNAGDIHLLAEHARIENSAIAADSLGEGRGGAVSIEVGSLSLAGGSSVSSSALDAGDGGSIAVSAEESVVLSGRGASGSPSRLDSFSVGSGNGGDILISSPVLILDQGKLAADTLGEGSGGDISIQAGRLKVANGGTISSSTLGETGPGGNIRVQAWETLTLSGPGSGIYTASTGDGPGGSIEVLSPRVHLSSGSRISAKSTAAGDAGEVKITAFDSFLIENSAVDVQASQADAGDILISVPHLVHLKNSTISASVAGGPKTTGGNVSIDPEYLILANSSIVANATEGRGGNIRIVAGVFLSDPLSRVDASSSLGIDGTVDIRTPADTRAETSAPLRSDFLKVDSLLRDPCAVRLQEGRESTLVLGGRDGLPVEPGSLLPSPVFAEGEAFRNTEGEAFGNTEGEAFGNTEGTTPR